jgi:hypothetical protein
MPEAKLEKQWQQEGHRAIADPEYRTSHDGRPEHRVGEQSEVEQRIWTAPGMAHIEKACRHANQHGSDANGWR